MTRTPRNLGPRLSAAILICTTFLSGTVPAAIMVGTQMWTLHDMLDAASGHDAARLASHLDLRALRRNALRRASRAIDRQMAHEGVHALDPQAIAGMLMQPPIETAMGDDLPSRLTRRSDGDGDTGIVYRVERRGVRSFTVHILVPQRINLTFTLEGARWMLTDLWGGDPNTPTMA